MTGHSQAMQLLYFIITVSSELQVQLESSTRFIEIYSILIGYEPAGLTVHPPPQNDRGWVHFFHMGV